MLRLQKAQIHQARKTTGWEAQVVLTAMYELGRRQLRPDLGTLSHRLGWGVGRVVRVQRHLATKALVDAQAGRLTLAGLAIATSLIGASSTKSDAA